MAPPTRRGKRDRLEPDEVEAHSLASSVKKCRLNGGAAASPPDSQASSALSGTGRRSSGRGGAPKVQHDGRASGASSYDVPESEEEQQEVPVRRSGTSKRAASGSSKATRSSIYDFPGSGDELEVPPEPPVQSAGSQGTRKRGVNGQNHTKSTGATRASEPLSSKPRGKRGSRAFGSAELPEPSADEEDVALRSTTRRLGRERLVASTADSEPATNSTPLKGILTPTKRRGALGRKKSVAFDGPETEVFFEDLPNKAKNPVVRTTGKAQTSNSGGDEDHDHETVADSEEGQDQDADEEGLDEDFVCVICSRPESAPPNEIVLCDNCDRGYHQKCHGLKTIPKGEWLCRECVDDSETAVDEVQVITKPAAKRSSSSIAAAAASAPSYAAPTNVPNFDKHLQTLQRVLLDRCTGKTRIRLHGQDEAYEKAFQLVEQTVLAGEGNSMLVIGARGSGKTTLIENIISDLSAEHKNDFHVVRLSGFIHTDDKIALKEIWRQLGKEMEVEDELIKKTSNYADTLASLLAVLSHPTEISGGDGPAESTSAAGAGVVMSKSVVFVMDEFDLFATHARQTLLYNLFDIAQARKAPIAVVGLTCRVDVVESLEKRVKSRFSHRHVHLSLPKSVAAFWDVCKWGLVVDERDLTQDLKQAPAARGGAAALSTTTAAATMAKAAALVGQKKFCEWWNGQIEALRQDAAFEDHLEFHFYSSKSVPAFLTSLILPLSELSPSAPRLRMPAVSATAAGGGSSLSAPDSKLPLLASLSDLDLALLVAAARLDIVAHTDTVNFAMAYDEYTSLIGRQRVQTATSGVFALGGSARAWGRGVAATAWERLVAVGLLTPAAGAGLGRGGGGVTGSNLGLGAKMWKVDVALEEIPTAAGLKPASILARWCREI